MATLNREKVLSVHHWNDTLFSFTTTRDRGLRFRSGHFVMIGLEVEGRPLLRAFSFAGAHYDDRLEFYSIKVPDGPLTSRLQHIRPGDEILVGTKPTGTLVLGTLRPGKRLYLFATGTGLAPFLSIIRDPETYQRYEHVVVVHGVRRISELGYRGYIREELPRHELVGEEVSKQLLYYPTVTREDFEHRGRITELLGSGKLTADLGLPDLDPEHDRAMICGSPAMLEDLTQLLARRGFRLGATHAPADYTYERAFVER
ncbi:MAG: ferredoxin--NADP reductase [Myxococcales bacterium]|jgi:ferredoxin--NADP+ reductase